MLIYPQNVKNQQDGYPHLFVAAAVSCQHSTRVLLVAQVVLLANQRSHTVDGQNPFRTTWKSWLKSLLVGIYKETILLGFARRCEMDFATIHRNILRRCHAFARVFFCVLSAGIRVRKTLEEPGGGFPQGEGARPPANFRKATGAPACVDYPKQEEDTSV